MRSQAYAPLAVGPLQSCSLNLKLLSSQNIVNWPCPCPDLEGGQESKCLKDRKEDGLAIQAQGGVRAELV